MFVAITMVACSKEKSSTPSSKNLFSLWTSSTAGSLDLRAMDFGAYAISIAYTANSGCNCTIELDGTQKEGTATIHSCSHYGPANYCDPGTSIYGYVNENANLTVCLDGGDCDVYR